MHIERYDEGVPSWVDLGAPDPQQAADFYSALFGWDVPPGAEEAGGYRVAMVGDDAVAGIGPQQSPGPPYWTTYVNVSDADATTAKVTANGGQVLVPPMDVLDAGRMAVFMDPLGAAFSVWQPNQHPGATLVNEPGTWSWSELVTTDVEASKAFYAAVFGWGSETHGDGPGAYTEWKVDGRSVGGLMAKPPDDARRGAAALGRLLLGGRHRRGGRAHPGARRFADHAVVRGRAGPHGSRHGPGRRAVQRDHAQRVAARLSHTASVGAWLDPEVRRRARPKWSRAWRSSTRAPSARWSTTARSSS